MGAGGRPCQAPPFTTCQGRTERQALTVGLTPLVGVVDTVSFLLQLTVEAPEAL